MSNIPVPSAIAKIAPDGNLTPRQKRRFIIDMILPHVKPGNGIEVDVLFGDYLWLEEALTNTKRDAAGYPIIGLPYLTILKMRAQRAQDWADVSRMLGWASEADLDEVRAVVKRYAPEDLEDLGSLIFIGKKEQEILPGEG